MCKFFVYILEIISKWEIIGYNILYYLQLFLEFGLYCNHDCYLQIIEEETSYWYIYEGGFNEEMYTIEFEEENLSDSEDEWSLIRREYRRKLFDSKLSMFDFDKLRKFYLIYDTNIIKSFSEFTNAVFA
jgi:hypothetical protein